MSLQTLERNSPSPQESVSESEDQGSLSSYEGFVCREGCAICLTPRPGASVGKHGGSLRIMGHLKKLNKLMRPQDAIKLAVELENCSIRPTTRYMVVIATQGVQDTEETIVLGTEQAADSVKVCMVLPLWRNTDIKLDGDGGFSVHCQDKHHVLKPCSVQSMWTALQFLFKATERARFHNYYEGGLSHTWMTFYLAQRTDDGVILNEWNLQSSVVSFRPDSPIYYDVSGVLDWSQLDNDKKIFKNNLIQKLREIMLHTDLEEVTSRQLRLKLEADMKMDLSEYKGFLDQQTLFIYGQLKEPSKIHDYLYLGTEWNAANLVELKELGVGSILNITREIDNFYPETFKYKTIRVYDVPESELLKHWDDTYKFIKEVKENKSKVLVHCKMGISRSAATVIAYTMKEYRMSLEDAHLFVKSQRSCVNPNPGFMSQLKAYEGILKARYNDLFGTQAPSRISYQSRSSSDPNIRQRLFQDVSNDEWTTPVELEIEENLIQMRPGSAGTSASNPIDLTLETRVNDSLPPEKAEGMINYLVSLRPPQVQEDEQDQGINIHASSDSDSSFSSPPFTPPNEGTLNSFSDKRSESSKHASKEASPSVAGDKESDSLNRQVSPHALEVPTSPFGSESCHDRITRAASLPITLRPSSAERPYPHTPSKLSKSPSSSHTQGSQEELDKLMEVVQVEENDEGEKLKVKTTLINSVTHRIKEIEQMNRPDNADKKADSTCMSHASSEDSLHSYTLRGQSESTCNKDRSLSPIPSDEHVVSGNTLPFISSNISTTYSDSQNNSRTNCDSLTTRYEKANEAAKLLLEQKRVFGSDQATLPDVKVSVDDMQLDDDNTTSKGIKELMGKFNKSSDDTTTASSLRRSSSLRSSNDPKTSHKRGSSFGDIV